MNARWRLLLIPPFIFSVGLLLLTQGIFARVSFFRDLRHGKMEEVFQLTNYITVFTDPYYLNSLILTIEISVVVAILAVLLAYPVAYQLARMPARRATLLLTIIVITSFITIVIKVLGLIIIFGADGPINYALKAIGLIDQPINLYGSSVGVLVGLLQYTLVFMVLILYSVIQSIPRSLEEAAEIHGASRWRVILKVVLPLSLPGVIAGALTVFNLAAGAFTSAALLGGGKVLTLPVLIQQEVIVNLNYGIGGTLSVILLLMVLGINLLSVWIVTRMRSSRLEVI